MQPSSTETSASKRLQREYAIFMKESPKDKAIFIVEKSVFECHFSFKGSSDSEFSEGIYHGKFIFPYDYPKNPPEVHFLSVNGRFAVNQKICLSITSFHPESWTPTWTISSMLEAIRAFMNTPAADAVGALDASVEMRKEFAKKSQHFKCPVCGADHSELLKYFDAIKKKDIENAKLQSSLTISPSNNNSEMNSENDSINDVVKQTSPIIENEEVISNSKQNTTTQEELQPNDSETLINETNVLSEEILTQNEEKETKIDNEEKETTIDNEESIENKSEEEIDPLEMLRQRQEEERRKLEKMLSQEEQATDIISNTKAEMLDEGINIAIYLAIFLISIIMLNYVKICAIVYFSK